MNRLIRTWSIVTLLITTLLLPSFSFAVVPTCVQPMSMSTHLNIMGSAKHKISPDCPQDVSQADKAQDKNQLSHKASKHKSQLDDCCSANCLPSYTSTHYSIHTYITGLYYLDIPFFQHPYTSQYHISLYRPPIV